MRKRESAKRRRGASTEIDAQVVWKSRLCWRVVDSVDFALSSFKGGLAAGGLKGWMRVS